MKRMIINSIELVLLICGMTIAACQQDEAVGNVSWQAINGTRSNGILRCVITTTKEGQVDSLLVDWGKRNGASIDAITHLTVSGPINKLDLERMRDFEKLDSLILQNMGLETFPRYGMFGFKSRATIVLLDDLSAIEDVAFYNCNAKYVALPNSLVTIGKSAFEDSGIDSIHISDNVTNIGEGTFDNCKNLTRVRLPKRLTEIRADMFRSCAALSEITIPESVKRIETGAFEFCSSLKSVKLPDNLEYMESEVFKWCSNLEQVEWPLSLNKIPDQTFAYCSKLKFSIPDYIKTIGYGAFLSCESITEFYLPESVETVGASVFCGTGIESVIITSKTAIGEKMFANTPMKNVKIEEGITAIPDGIFSGCSSLESIHLPLTITEVGNEAFYGCNELSTVVLNKNLKRIGRYAFHGCNKLQSITFPEGLETIGNYSFEQTALNSATLPSTVRELGIYAFHQCHNLESITLNEGLEILGRFAFRETPLVTLTIPSTVTGGGGGYVSNGIVDACTHMTSIFWNSPIEAPDLIQDDERNLLVYLPYGNSVNENTNLIVNGTAPLGIVLKSSGDFHCPQSFVSDVIYRREFNATSGIGKASGWQTIVLPFDVTSIKCGKQVLTPFGTELAGAKHFWLRELTSAGFTRATKIEANKPYIIAMPNNPAYMPEYNITGTVTFGGNNVTIPVTEEPSSVVGNAFDLCPTYKILSADDDRLVLNTNDYYYNGIKYSPGSIFVSNAYPCNTFEAYVSCHTNTRAIPVSVTTNTRTINEVGLVPSEDDM